MKKYIAITLILTVSGLFFRSVGLDCATPVLAGVLVTLWK